MASWSRAARACVQAGARSLLRPGTDAQAAARPALRDQQSRGMASGACHVPPVAVHAAVMVE